MNDQTRARAEGVFREEGITPHTWSNEPHYVYAEHEHPYHKVLFCVAGSITFQTPAGIVAMRSGDRLDLPPGTPHSATVGAAGVTCMEAARD